MIIFLFLPAIFLGFGYGCVAMINKFWITIGILAPLIFCTGLYMLSSGWTAVGLIFLIPIFLIVYWSALAIGYHFVYKKDNDRK